MKFSIKDFFSKCDQICRKLWISSHLLKKPLMDNFIFCAVKRFLILNILTIVIVQSLPQSFIQNSVLCRKLSSDKLFSIIALIGLTEYSLCYDQTEVLRQNFCAILSLRQHKDDSNVSIILIFQSFVTLIEL